MQALHLVHGLLAQTPLVWSMGIMMVIAITLVWAGRMINGAWLKDQAFLFY
ncbi:MAG TPA: hypothetical protein VG984_02680 [Candidatus Paceibacterota bacterium]|nr:hypothetical protein [Candidatus Paceibacterota bacterium]